MERSISKQKKIIILNCSLLATGFLCLTLLFIFLFPTKCLAFSLLFPLEWFLLWNLISKGWIRKDEVFALREQYLSESPRQAKAPLTVTEAFFSAGWRSTETSTGVLAAKWIKHGFTKPVSWLNSLTLNIVKTIIKGYLSLFLPPPHGWSFHTLYVFLFANETWAP